jgi:hypothetical protein
MWAVNLQKYSVLRYSRIADDVIPLLRDSIRDTEALCKAYTLSAEGFTIFVVALIVCSPYLRSLRLASEASVYSSQTHQLARPLQAIAILLWIATSIAILATGVGINGVSSGSSLPYRIAGFIVWSRTILCPVLLLTAESIRLRHDVKCRVSWGFLAIMTGFGLSDSILRASKGALATQALLIGLFCISYLIRNRRVLSVHQVVAVLLLVLLLPAVSTVTATYRDQVRRTGSLGIAGYREAMGLLHEAAVADEDTMSVGAGSFVMRLTGIEQLAVAIRTINAPMWKDYRTLYDEGGISHYFTYAIYGYPVSAPMGIAPSYFGWWYVVLGDRGPLVGGGFMAMVLCLLTSLGKAFRSLPEVWEAASGLLVATVLVEGSVDNLIPFVVALSSCCVVEWLVRASDFTPRQSKRRDRQLDPQAAHARGGGV